MAKTPAIERPTSLKILGIGFLALLVFFVWVTFAFFNKVFVSSVDVELTASTAGAQLPKDADVKLRGMIVGEVREIVPENGGVRMRLAMKPDLIDEVPAGVSAQILPKTLFGEKYIALIPPETVTGEALQAGDVITQAEVPIELEEVLNDLQPLLEAVSPDDLSYTLSAVSIALDGRGEQLGDTLVTLNSYLREINPDVPLLIDDLDKLGDVADVYNAALPDLGRLLENLVVTGNTVVDKRAELSAFLTQTTDLGNTLSDFVAASGQDIIDLNAAGRRPLEIASRYSPTFPCFLNALDTMVPRLDSVLRDAAVHIDLEIISPLGSPDTPGGMPDAYAPEERAAATAAEIDATQYGQPDCLQLDALAEGQDLFPQSNPYRIPDAQVYELVGVRSPHGKFFSPEEIDSSEAGPLQRVIAASLGKPAGDLPDLATLLVWPALSGAEVSISEAR